MQKFTVHTGQAVPLYRANIDTDQIIPKQFLTRIERTGYGAFHFYDWRVGDDGGPNKDFVLNDPVYAGASILIAGPNFGCGSSREHAAWSLLDHGFRAVIAPSFGDIFYTNSLKNGLLPLVLDQRIASDLARQAKENPPLSITVDLVAKTVSSEAGHIADIVIDDFRRHCLINGLDENGITLQHADAIAHFERSHPNSIAAA